MVGNEQVLHEYDYAWLVVSKVNMIFRGPAVLGDFFFFFGVHCK